MILVFKTNVTSLQMVTELAKPLHALLFPANWNFDLDDCDRILRVAGSEVSSQKVVATLAEAGFWCEELQ